MNFIIVKGVLEDVYLLEKIINGVKVIFKDYILIENIMIEYNMVFVNVG